MKFLLWTYSILPIIWGQGGGRGREGGGQGREEEKGGRRRREKEGVRDEPSTYGKTEWFDQIKLLPQVTQEMPV